MRKWPPEGSDIQESGGNDRRRALMTGAKPHDIDALDFIDVPVWYDRHPSQAEGEDY